MQQNFNVSEPHRTASPKQLPSFSNSCTCEDVQEEQFHRVLLLSDEASACVTRQRRVVHPFLTEINWLIDADRVHGFSASLQVEVLAEAEVIFSRCLL